MPTKNGIRRNGAIPLQRLKNVSEEHDLSQAAISSSYAAEYFGLNILSVKQFLQTLIILPVYMLQEKVYAKDAHKISVSYELPHESGSLYNSLSHFIYNGLNMTKIESRPILKRNWEYRFFVDFEGNLSDSAVKNALRGLRSEVQNLRVHGNY